jgi:hypothetical protein
LGVCDDGMSLSAVVAAIVAVVLAGCLGGRGESEGWTVEQAESIAEVRGLPVRVAGCRGLGRGERDGKVLRYARFACSAGARARGDRFDTVAVLFEVHVRDDSAPELQAVRFVGGPGIP